MQAPWLPCLKRTSSPSFVLCDATWMPAGGPWGKVRGSCCAGAVQQTLHQARPPHVPEAPFAGSADAKVAYAFILEVLARAVREGLDSATLQ